MMCNNPNLDLINIDAKFNAYTKFGDLLSIYSQDIEWKRNFDRHTEPGTTQIQYSPALKSIAPLFKASYNEKKW